MDSSQLLLAILIGGALLLLMGGILAFFMGLSRLSARSTPGERPPIQRPVEQETPASVARPEARVETRGEPRALAVGWFVGLAILLPLLALAVPRILQSVTAGRIGGPSAWDSLAQTVAGWSRAGAVLQTVVLGVLVYEYLYRGGRIQAGLLRREQVTFWAVVTGLLAGLGLWVVAFFTQRLVLAVFSVEWQRWFTPLKVDQTPLTWLAVLSALLIAPLVEELFFRGYVLPQWVERFGETWALIASALLAAAFSLNVLALPSLLLVNLGLGLLARRWGNLLPAWLAHTTFNLLLVLTVI